MMLINAQPRPPYYNQGQLPNGANNQSQAHPNHLQNNGRIIQNGTTRVLCVADVRGMSYPL